MFVVDETGNFAVNIEKAEKVGIDRNKIFPTYLEEKGRITYIVGTESEILAEYETLEAAEYAFQQMIIAIAKGDKVFFMPSDEEIENGRRS